MPKYFDLFKRFQVPIEDLQSYIDQWHESGDASVSVSEYLGMTKSEYGLFIRYPERVEALRGGVVADFGEGLPMSHFTSKVSGIQIFLSTFLRNHHQIRDSIRKSIRKLQLNRARTAGLF